MVNDQIVDSVTGTATLLTGQAPSNAFGMLDTVMVETLGMAMYNAVNRQQNAGMTGNAAVTAACARMLQTPIPIPMPPSPPPPPPPAVQDLPPPAPPYMTTAMAEAAALAQAQAAIATLQHLAKQSGGDAEKASTALADLIKQAGGVPLSNTSPAKQTDEAKSSDGDNKAGKGDAGTDTVAGGSN